MWSRKLVRSEPRALVEARFVGHAARCALAVSLRQGCAIRPEESWNMATTMGAASLSFAVPDLPLWRIQPGSKVPLISIQIQDAQTVEDLILRGSPEHVRFL